MSRFLARTYVRTGPPEVVQEVLADLKKLRDEMPHSAVLVWSGLVWSGLVWSAHLRSTKECMTLEYLEKENKSIAEKEEGGKYLKGEIVILQRRRKTGKEKEENIWRKNIFWFQSE